MLLYKQDLSKVTLSLFPLLKRGGAMLSLLSLAIFMVSYQQREIKANRPGTRLEKGDYAIINQDARGIAIWSIGVTDLRQQKVSLVTSSWDTLMNLPLGNEISYSLWREFPVGRQQVTNLGFDQESVLDVSTFSPAFRADTSITLSGKLMMKPKQSVDYWAEGMATIRMTALSGNSHLVYCVFGNDSIVPVALNTASRNIPMAFKEIKGLKTTDDNHYQFRARWNGKRLFFVYLPYLKDSVQIEFFPG